MRVAVAHDRDEDQAEELEKHEALAASLKEDLDKLDDGIVLDVFPTIIAG